MGCRGFAGRSLCKVYSWLGITGAAKRKAIKTTMEAAERASRWLWIRRSGPILLGHKLDATAGTQTRVSSALAGSPEGRRIMAKDPKRLIISGTSLKMCPGSSLDVSLTQKKRSSSWILLFSRQLINSFTWPYTRIPQTANNPICSFILLTSRRTSQNFYVSGLFHQHLQFHVQN